MTTLSIFKGHKNTLSYHSSDTQHRELKDPFSKSQEAINDLNSLIIQTKGNNIDNHFLPINTWRKTFQRNHSSHKKKPLCCLSDSQKSRFYPKENEKKELMSSISSKFIEKIQLLNKKKAKNDLNLTNLAIKPIYSYRDPTNRPLKQMTSSNFSKYMNFLNSVDHVSNETSNKKAISTIKISPKRRNSNSYYGRSPDVDSNSKAQNAEFLAPKIEESSAFPRLRTIRKSILSENVIMEKMNFIAKRVMKNLKKLELLNHNNKIKTYNELNKLFNNNSFLNGIFFDLSGKEMNPKLSESFLAQSVVIYPSKFNRNPLENKIKYNNDGIKVLESLSEKIKEFCFNKKLLELQSEEKDIVDLQKALKRIEGKYIHKPNSVFWKKMQMFSTNIEIPPTFNSQISKMIKVFEERHGRLDKVKEKSKIVGEKVDNMFQDIYDKFVLINNNKI